MSRSPSQYPDDPFGGLLLPVSAWKALEEAHITNLQQLKTMAPVIDQIPYAGSEIAQAIRKSLGQLTTKKSVRVRLIFPRT